MEARGAMTKRVRSAVAVAAACGGLLVFASATGAARTADPGQTSVAVTDLTNGETPGQLAQSLVGSGVTISNVTYTGSARAAGEFTQGASSIGLGSGVVLSSGKVETESTDSRCSVGVEGPDTCYEATGGKPAGPSGTADSTAFGLPGDPDLNALVSPATTYDAAVLQFDFVPTGPVIQISYVFGSEEYSDYVNKFNDVFGFFVNGQNCALVPGTDEPVSVDSINNGSDAQGGDTPPHNVQYFRDNVRPSPSIDSQLDGLTTVLTCTAQVKAGQVNHMKLAIADTSDDKLDSAVFLGAGSFISAIQSGPATSFTGTAPDEISGPLATFTDPNQAATASSYASTIDWGDGTTGTGTITGSDGSFTVSGDHTYSTPGSYTIAVTTAANDNATNTTTTTDQATIRSPISASGTSPIAGSAPTTLSGPVAQFTVSDATATAASYAATIDWGDGTNSPGTITGSNGTFTVSGDHTYATPGSYPITVTISDLHDQHNTATTTNNADITPVCPGTSAQSAPLIVTAAPAPVTTSTVVINGAVNTCGLQTTVYLQYGLDNRYRLNPAPGITYDQQSAAQTLPPGTAPATVALPVSGLVPNAVYHARIVASNAVGTTQGPDQTFTTLEDGTAGAQPAAPVLAKSFDASTVSGLVLVKLPQDTSARAHGGRKVKVTLPRTNGFFPLTEALSLPVGTRVDTRKGALSLRTAGNHKGQTQSGVFRSALFSVKQGRSGAGKGVTTLSLVDGAYPGAPSYSECQAPPRSGAVRASIAKLSPTVLQTLRAHAKGRFRTVGRYSAGTVRGTEWNTIDRCDGTLTVVFVHTVDVYDFTRHVTVAVHAGHSYLARAPHGLRP
jgi:hypothetical protein